MLATKYPLPLKTRLNYLNKNYEFSFAFIYILYELEKIKKIMYFSKDLVVKIIYSLYN